MCGIAGLLNLNGAPLFDDYIAQRMASYLHHRGPDDEGSLTDGPVAFGFRRLRIIDLEGGHQPISNETGSISAMLNGEIYNFRELRGQLETRGHRFRTNSDTEVIVHSYETYGLEFVRWLRGMFAIALWDADKRVLVLVRDRLGKKPLFWSRHRSQLAFASELKALLPWQGLDRTLDPEAVHDYLSFLSVPAPKSIFQHVRKLPPAHLLVADSNTGSIDIRRYWQLEAEPDFAKPREYYVEGLRELLEESVDLRLRSDVPVGALLSGGVDSTAVVGLMCRRGPVKTFSMGFEDPQFDETSYSRLAAKTFRTDHTEEVVSGIDRDVLENLAWFLDEPFADSSAIPTYQISRIARREVTVALSGDGGDELFAGYPRYAYARWLRDLARLPSAVSTATSSLLLQIQRAVCGPDGSGGEPLRRLSKAFYVSSLPEAERVLALLSYYDDAEKRRLYTAEFATEINGYSSLRVVEAALAKFSGTRQSDPIVAFAAQDLETNLADDALVKVDRMSMACSLEMRSPLLDHKLVEFACRIPPHYKLRGGNGKLIFKDAVTDVLPHAIKHRDKRGFDVPLGRWLRSSEWKALLEDCLSEESVKRRGLFKPEAVAQMRRVVLEEPTATLGGFSARQLWHRIWILVMFELWARHYLDRRHT